MFFNLCCYLSLMTGSADLVPFRYRGKAVRVVAGDAGRFPIVKDVVVLGAEVAARARRCDRGTLLFAVELVTRRALLRLANLVFDPHRAFDSVARSMRDHHRLMALR